MSGAIIENMSTKKLIFFGLFILSFQLLFVLLGAFIAPSPTAAVSYLATKCISRHGVAGSLLAPWGPGQCQQIRSFDQPVAKMLDANDIVFSVHIPVPGTEMSPWFQYMLLVLQVDVSFRVINQIEGDVVLTVDAGLAYRDVLTSDWTTKFHSMEERPLRCAFALPKTYENEGRFYECDPVPLMELGSVAHKYYLLNLRLPANSTTNVGVGEIKDVLVVAIHQNGGFTKVWLSMKTLSAPGICGATLWYWHRIVLAARQPALLEQAILALGVSTVMLDLPAEWLSLVLERTWMLLFVDVQQGVFYGALFCFWIIFCGEHLMDGGRRNRLAAYWWQVGLVLFGSAVLLFFDLSERGTHLTNPFYSIWASDMGTMAATTFIVVAAISACLYFLSLCGTVICVFRNIGKKMQQLHAMPPARRQRYQGIIFRFKFLMLVTLACAALTIVFFILNQVSEGNLPCGHYTLKVHSAFLTGIFGMWNLYVFSIVFLYAPSHKKGSESAHSLNADVKN
ncbi:protein wntless homolog isoform X2 [Nelusetta ayraudi]|uniref:protein wntless homolog isoform X2 n=1 Tax=Nelusetta ayraudi TaxID=303726 RepID=UPI003F71883A